MRSQSFFDNEPKQILSAIPDLSAKNKQTVAPSIRGTATTTKQPLLLLLRFQIIQSTLPYRLKVPATQHFTFQQLAFSKVNIG